MEVLENMEPFDVVRFSEDCGEIRWRTEGSPYDLRGGSQMSGT